MYCGDHDPDGLRISDTLRANLEQVRLVQWEDGIDGYDPVDLEIHRFGLNYDFIIKNNYTWIDNLVSQGGELARIVNGRVVAGLKTKGKHAGEEHQNFKLPYLQNYVKDYGVRKCEANAIVTTPTKAKQLIIFEIEKWLGKNALSRFQKKRDAITDQYKDLLDETNLTETIEKIIEDNEE